MDVAIIDYYANSGSSFLHRAKALSKLIFAALVITSVVISSDMYLLLGIYLSLASLVIWSRLPLIKVISIAAYPAIFALIFAVASWNGSWIRAGVIILKALTAALTMVILIVTTPYPDIFSSIRPVLPKIIAEGMVLTYRSVFILLELTDNLVKALRVRGGLTRRRYLKNIVNFSSGIGLLLVRGLDMSEKFYGVMNVRGYGGKMLEGQREEKAGRNDFAAVILGGLILTVSLMIRFEAGPVQYGAYLTAFSVLAFIASALYILLEKHRVIFWKS
ncbi:MAG: energy-coupling factor transporter transmembrane component T [Deltaproteobacteria bacterium]